MNSTQQFILDRKEQVLSGKKISSDDAFKLINISNSELVTLGDAANEITRKFNGPKVDVEQLVNIKKNYCSEDCSFCSQSAFFNTDINQGLERWSLDDQFLRVYYRAPKGYVVVRDANGKPYPLLKKAAQIAGLWKPAKRPPISVSDWSALKKSSSVIKKLTKVTKRAESIANYKAGRTRTKTKYLPAPAKC